MELLTQLLHALWAQDFETLANPSMIGMLYFVLFMILFLENGLLPAAFLPGDSLLVLVGVLCAKGAMAFPQTILLLTIAASLGCWVSYIQGRWLGNTRIVQNWLSHLPAHYHQRAHHLFHKHGLSALLIGRFIAFVRTLLPTIAGLSGLSSARFQFFNWMSGLLWVLILTTLGYALGKTPVFMKYEDQLMSCLMLLPVVLLVFGLVGSLVVLWKKNTGPRANNGHFTVIPAPLVLRIDCAGIHQRDAADMDGAPAPGIYTGNPASESGSQRTRRFFHLAPPGCKRDPLQKHHATR
jgi:membrane protein DedA with SNARE-associated domain